MLDLAEHSINLNIHAAGLSLSSMSVISGALINLRLQKKLTVPDLRCRVSAARASALLIME